MFEQRKNIRRSTSIAQIKETYRDHPCMHRLNAFKEQLKQERLQDQVFSQSSKKRKTSD